MGRLKEHAMDVAYSIAKSEGVRIKSDSQWEHYWNLAVRQIDGHPWRSPLAQKLLGEGLRRSPELAQMFTENELYDYASISCCSSAVELALSAPLPFSAALPFENLDPNYFTQTPVSSTLFLSTP